MRFPGPTKPTRPLSPRERALRDVLLSQGLTEAARYIHDWESGEISTALQAWERHKKTGQFLGHAGYYTAPTQLKFRRME